MWLHLPWPSPNRSNLNLPPLGGFAMDDSALHSPLPYQLSQVTWSSNPESATHWLQAESCFPPGIVLGDYPSWSRSTCSALHPPALGAGTLSLWLPPGSAAFLASTSSQLPSVGPTLTTEAKPSQPFSTSSLCLLLSYGALPPTGLRKPPALPPGPGPLHPSLLCPASFAGLESILHPNTPPRGLLPSGTPSLSWEAF